MKKFLLTTAIFMGISVLAFAQENAAKSSNEAEIEKTKTEKAVYEKKLAEQRITQRNETDKREAQKVGTQDIEVKIKQKKEIEKRNEIEALPVLETELSPATSGNLATDMKEVTVARKTAPVVNESKPQAKSKTKAKAKKKVSNK